MKSGHSIVIAVTQHRRTPPIPELHAESLLSPRAAILSGILHRCWCYDPTERATAYEVTGLVSFLARADDRLLICFEDGIRWTSFISHPTSFTVQHVSYYGVYFIKPVVNSDLYLHTWGKSGDAGSTLRLGTAKNEVYQTLSERRLADPSGSVA
jgi:hypothetical protein